jgi:hypothetical protein
MLRRLVLVSLSGKTELRGPHGVRVFLLTAVFGERWL